MAFHNDTDREGEEYAALWLTGCGFEIMQRNWRSGRFEIDIIAVKDKTLHFIEVKTRKSISYGLPENLVSRSKLKQFIDAGAAYLSTSAEWNKVRFDILAVSITNDQPEYLFITDVYC